MYTRLLKKLSRTRLDDVLIDEAVLDRTHIDDAQAESEMTGRPLSHVLFEREEVDEWELAKIVARNYSLPFVDITQYAAPSSAQCLLDLEFCRTHLLAPFDEFGCIPAIAVCEMPGLAVLEEIQRRCGELPFVYVTLRSRLLEVLAEREEAGVVPATAADMPERTPPPEPEAAAAPSAGGSQPSAPALALDPVCMRLGFNMHMRAPGAGGNLPPELRRARARKPVTATVSTETPSITEPAPPSEPVQAPAAAAGAETASWQSIFDLGDEAVDGGD